MKTQHLILKERDSYTRIKFDHITKIVVNGDCVTIHKEQKGKTTISRSLKSIKENLPEDFVYINRNIIVNTLKATKFQSKEKILTLENGEKLQVSTRRVKEVKRFFRVR